MTTNEVTILFMEPTKNPELRVIPDELKSYQELVGGSIEMVRILPDIALICNKEGKLLDFTPNRHFHLPFFKDIVVGNIVFVKISDETGEFVSLTAKDIERLNQAFSDKNYISEV